MEFISYTCLQKIGVPGESGVRASPDVHTWAECTHYIRSPKELYPDVLVRRNLLLHYLLVAFSLDMARNWARAYSWNLWAMSTGGGPNNTALRYNHSVNTLSWFPTRLCHKRRDNYFHVIYRLTILLLCLVFISSQWLLIDIWLCGIKQHEKY